MANAPRKMFFPQSRMSKGSVFTEAAVGSYAWVVSVRNGEAPSGTGEISSPPELRSREIDRMLLDETVRASSMNLVLPTYSPATSGIQLRRSSKRLASSLPSPQGSMRAARSLYRSEWTTFLVLPKYHFGLRTSKRREASNVMNCQTRRAAVY